MERDGLHQRGRQSPDAHQISPQLRMRTAQKLGLRILDGAAVFLESLPGLVVLLWPLAEQNHLADIVQQAGGKRLLRHCLVARLLRRDPLGQRSHGDAVLPQ